MTGMENSMIEEMMEIDLNQEPLEMNNIGNANGRILEGIRQLEAIASRAMQRQRHQRGQTNADAVRLSMSNIHIASNVKTVENGKGCKRDSSHLMTKALENNGGGFYDCNICLDVAREPILTCCGHLFCWPCFYMVPYIQSDLRECPVCKGEVSSKTITPIYGTSDKTCKSKTVNAGMEIPPRPQARRTKSRKQRCRVRRERQERINRGFSTTLIAEALRQDVTDGTYSAGEQLLPVDSDSVHITSERNNSRLAQVFSSVQPPGAEAESNQNLPLIQLSRLLSQQAASLSSLSTDLSSALSSVESMIGDFETVANRQPMRSNL